jgi:hypothetical protein
VLVRKRSAGWAKPRAVLDSVLPPLSAAANSTGGAAMTCAIGGSLDYRRMAELHRPTNAETIATEIRRLNASGLKARDGSLSRPSL